MLEDAIRGEVVEKELDALITRRALKTTSEQQRIEDGWAESTCKHNAQLRTEHLWERLNYHRAMLEAHSRNFEVLLKRHKVGLRLCEEALGITGEKGSAA